MKKVSYFISAAVVALGLASCSKEDVVSSNSAQTNRQITIIANTEGSVDTKTSLSGDDATGYEVLWSEGDKINLDDNSVFTLTAGAGTTRGTFVAVDQVGDGTCPIYYANNGKTLVSGSHYIGEGVISSAPMVASVTIEKGQVTSVTEFKNMCGLLRLTLKGSGTVREVRVIDDDPLYGQIENIASDGAVTIKKSEYVRIYTLTQDCGEGVELSDEGTDFYFPVPPGSYSGVKIEIKDFSGHTVTKTMKSTSSLNITRAQITPVSLTVSGLGKKPDVPAGSLCGEFTVQDPDGVKDSGDERKVYFSRGNMYCIAPPLNSTSFGTFLFEENQYNFSKEAYNRDHVSRFCWATDENQSFNVLTTSYFRDGSFFTNNGDFVVNGTWEKYRTLSKDEWEYLFVHHDHRYVTVNGVEGRVIAPDEVKLADNKSTYTPSELKNDNLVFLPFAGRRYGQSYRNDADGNVYGYYWSCTTYNDSYSYGLIIKQDGVEYVSMDIDNGCAIRLVTDKK